MSFYRRYSGFGRELPTLAPASTAPSEGVPPAKRAADVARAVRPPIPAVYVPSMNTLEIGPQASPLLFLSPRPVEPLLMVNPAPAPAAAPAKPVRTSPRAGQTMVFPKPEIPPTTDVSQDFIEKNHPEAPPPEVEQIISVPMPDGTTAVAVVKQQPPMMAIAAAAAGGFLLGGPLGAVLGAAAGYFLAPKKASAKISHYY